MPLSLNPIVILGVDRGPFGAEGYCVDGPLVFETADRFAASKIPKLDRSIGPTGDHARSNRRPAAQRNVRRSFQHSVQLARRVSAAQSRQNSVAGDR